MAGLGRPKVDRKLYENCAKSCPEVAPRCDDRNNHENSRRESCEFLDLNFGANNFVTRLSGIGVGKMAIGVGDNFGKYNLANLADKPTWPGQAQPGQVVN